MSTSRRVLLVAPLTLAVAFGALLLPPRAAPRPDVEGAARQSVLTVGRTAFDLDRRPFRLVVEGSLAEPALLQVQLEHPRETEARSVGGLNPLPEGPFALDLPVESPLLRPAYTVRVWADTLGDTYEVVSRAAVAGAARGILARAWVSTTRRGRPVRSVPRRGGQLWVHFLFAVTPDSARPLVVEWFGPRASGGRVTARMAQQIDTRLRVRRTPGAWRIVLRARIGGRLVPVATIRFRVR
jgi:hypothetical protein